MGTLWIQKGNHVANTSCNVAYGCGCRDSKAAGRHVGHHAILLHMRSVLGLG
jgi:hypothetical protein